MDDIDFSSPDFGPPEQATSSQNADFTDKQSVMERIKSQMRKKIESSPTLNKDEVLKLIQKYVSNSGVPAAAANFVLSEGFDKLAGQTSVTISQPFLADHTVHVYINGVREENIVATPPYTVTFPPLLSDSRVLVDIGRGPNGNIVDTQLRIDLASNASGKGVDLVNNAVRRVENIAEMQALTGLRGGTRISVTGYYTTAVSMTPDGGGGEFIYRASSAATHNGGTVFTATGMGAGRFHRIDVDGLNVRHFGATGSGNESTICATMISTLNRLRIPSGLTITAKNLELLDNTEVVCDGALKLPAGCSDFDRLLYGAGKSNLVVKIREIDGNYAGQSGSIGTHLVYLTNCIGALVNVRHAHDHYIASGAAMPSVDGIRNASSGAIYLYRCHDSEVNIGMLEGWGREGIYLEECDDSEASLGHAQGTLVTEYSGIQVKGNRSKLLRASVDNAGASGVGFDVIDGTLDNVITTNTRENHGVNFGHPSFPASGSVASNIVVDGAFVDGIKVSASTVDLTIDNFAIKNAGRYGISVSDSSVRGKFTNGVVRYSGQANIQVSATEIQTANVRYDDLDAGALQLTMTSGTYVAGETVTASGGKSAVVRAVVKNLSNTSEILLLSSVTGTFVATDVVTGGTSGAIGTVSLVSTPAKRLEQSSGIVADDIRLFSGTQDQIRFPDGTAIMTATVSAVIATPATLTTTTVNYSSNVAWASAPRIVAQVNSANSTGAYNVDQLEVSSTTTQIRLDMIASVAQTYGVSVFAIGRWK